MSHAAIRSSGRKAAIVAAMATRRAAITTRPRSGLRAPKKAKDQAQFKASWAKNSTIALPRPGAPSGTARMRQTATAIVT